MMTQPHIPSVMSDLRQDIVQMPKVIKNVVAFAFMVVAFVPSYLPPMFQLLRIIMRMPF